MKELKKLDEYAYIPEYHLRKSVNDIVEAVQELQERLSKVENQAFLDWLEQEDNGKS